MFFCPPPEKKRKITNECIMSLPFEKVLNLNVIQGFIVYMNNEIGFTGFVRNTYMELMSCVRIQIIKCLHVLIKGVF